MTCLHYYISHYALYPHCIWRYVVQLSNCIMEYCMTMYIIYIQWSTLVFIWFYSVQMSLYLCMYIFVYCTCTYTQCITIHMCIAILNTACTIVKSCTQCFITCNKLPSWGQRDHPHANMCHVCMHASYNALHILNMNTLYIRCVQWIYMCI